MYPNAIGIAMPIINSNHSLMILEPFPSTMGAGPLNMMLFLEVHAECRGLPHVVGSTVGCKRMFGLISLLKLTTVRSLHSWHKRSFKNVAIEFGKLKIELQKLLNEGDTFEN